MCNVLLSRKGTESYFQFFVFSAVDIKTYRDENGDRTDGSTGSAVGSLLFYTGTFIE